MIMQVQLGICRCAAERRGAALRCADWRRKAGGRPRRQSAAWKSVGALFQTLWVSASILWLGSTKKRVGRGAEDSFVAEEARITRLSVLQRQRSSSQAAPIGRRHRRHRRHSRHSTTAVPPESQRSRNLVFAHPSDRQP